MLIKNIFSKNSAWVLGFAVAAIFATTFVSCDSGDTNNNGGNPDPDVLKGDVVIWSPLRDSGAYNARVTGGLTDEVVPAFFNGSAPYPRTNGFWSMDYAIVKEVNIKYADEGVISGLVAGAIYKITTVVKSSNGTTVSALGGSVYARAGTDAAAGKVTLATTTDNDAGYYLEKQGADVYLDGTSITGLAAGVYYVEKLQDTGGSTGWVNKTTDDTNALTITSATATGFWRVRAKAGATYGTGDITIASATATSVIKVMNWVDFDTEITEYLVGEENKLALSSAVKVYTTDPAIVTTVDGAGVYVGASAKITVSQNVDTLVYMDRIDGTADTTNVGYFFVPTSKELTAGNGTIYSVETATGFTAGAIAGNKVTVGTAVIGDVYLTILVGGTTGSLSSTVAPITAVEDGKIPLAGSDNAVVYYQKVSDAVTWAYTTTTETSITPTGVAGAGDLAYVASLADATTSVVGYHIVGSDGKLKATASNNYNVRKVAGASEFVFVR